MKGGENSALRVEGLGVLRFRVVAPGFKGFGCGFRFFFWGGWRWWEDRVS